MRYAIYYTPGPNEPLTHAAARWLGRNPHDGSTQPVDHEFADLVTAPKKYGFHGTLKAPFRLAQSVTENDLLERFDQYRGKFEPLKIPSLKLDQLGAFFALVPGDMCEPLNELAANTVETFEPFRAPLTEAELAKRKPEQLSTSQRAHLKRWGYPYVFDEFRFHLTLTGPVPQEHAATVRGSLERHFAPFIGQPLHVESCTLFVEPEPGAPFHVYSKKKAAA